MMCEKVTAELRADGAIVLIIPDEELVDVVSAFMSGATCCRAVSKNSQFDEASREIALEAAECLERLEEISQTMGGPEPKRPILRLVKE